MNRETKPNKFTVFNEDVKKMSDAQLEASLRELRELASQMKRNDHSHSLFRRRAA